eukprot:scaffold117995_cov32-Tisochrysis_lutea.AAC.6
MLASIAARLFLVLFPRALALLALALRGLACAPTLLILARTPLLSPTPGRAAAAPVAAALA